MSYLNRILIKWRIFGGFGVLVLLGAGMAVYSIWAFSAVGANVTGLTTLSEITVRALTTSHTLEAMRRGATRYASSGDASLVKEFTDNQAKADALLKASAKATHSEDRQRLYNGVADELTAHRAFFDKLVNTMKEIESNRAKLFTDGDALTAATAKLVEAARASGNASVAAFASDVNAAVLGVGDASLRFLATNDPQGLATFQTNVEKAAAAIGALQKSAAGNELGSLIGPVSAALQAYKASFESVSAAMQTRDEVFLKGIDPQQADMQAKLTSAVDALVSDFGAAKDATQSIVVTTNRNQAAIAILSFVIGAAFAYLIGRGIVNPIAAMTAAMKKLAGGDKSVAIPSADARDEIGDMAKAVQVFKDNMIEADRLRAEQEQVKARAEAEKKVSMNKMADEFEGGVKGIVQMVTSAATELQATAQSMSVTAEETSRQATAVAAASEEASSNVETVASAAEELSSSIAEIGRQVSESARIAGEASEQATATNSQIHGLAESAQKIGDVVKLITDIAGQTNLLALNATIEAARAGEAGKGFAVVASEVKSLANQTAKATEEISAKIAEMQAATGQSVQAVQTIGETIGRINEIATAIASAVEEQGAATKEIARNVQQASAGTGEVSSNIAGVTKAAGDTGNAASQVLDAAGVLSKQSETLQTQVDAFIAKIRAA